MNFKKTLIACWFGVFTTSMGLSQIAPILPLFLRELGLAEFSEISFYSGLAFGITPIFMAIFAPLWAFLGAKFGYKKMLLRASFGMAIATFFLSFANSAEQVVLIRALTGVISGFGSAAVVFVAVISTKEHTAYNLSLLSTASISGSLLGPLFGGLIAEILGVRAVFEIVSFLIFCSFLTTIFFIKEKSKKEEHKKSLNFQTPSPKNSLIFILFFTTFIIQAGTFGSMPLLGIFTAQIYSGAHLALFSGLIVAASGFSNLFFGPKIGRLADKIGPKKIISAALMFCGICFAFQALVSSIWQLLFLRLLIGVGLGGLLPCVNALFRKSVPENKLSQILGFNQSAQFIGNFTGAVGGGILGGYFGLEFAFITLGLSFIINAVLFTIIVRKD